MSGFRSRVAKWAVVVGVGVFFIFMVVKYRYYNTQIVDMNKLAGSTMPPASTLDAAPTSTSQHDIVSAQITSPIRAPRNLKLFHPTAEFRPVADDEALPSGLDIKINLATGEKLARLHQEGTADSADQPAVVPVSGPHDVIDEDAEQVLRKRRVLPKVPPKWQIRFSSHQNDVERHLAMLDASDPAVVQQALDYFDDKAAAFEVGAGLMHSPKLPSLTGRLRSSDPAVRLAVANILFAAIHNNGPAMEQIASDKSPFNVLAVTLDVLATEQQPRILRKLLSIVHQLLCGSGGRDGGQATEHTLLELTLARNGIDTVQAAYKRYRATEASQRFDPVVLEKTGQILVTAAAGNHAGSRLAINTFLSYLSPYDYSTVCGKFRDDATIRDFCILNHQL